MQFTQIEKLSFKPPKANEWQFYLKESKSVHLKLYIIAHLVLQEGLALSDPGYFRQLAIRGGGGALKAPPPPTILKTLVSIFTILYMCILLGVLGMFQLEFFQKSQF